MPDAYPHVLIFNAGEHRFQPVHRILEEQEAVTVLADYEGHNRWLTPIIRRVLSWLIGWHYDSSDNAHRRLVRELPVVAFRHTPNPT